jgi:hypothetical protein
MEQPARLGRVGDDLGGHAGRGGLQADLDPPELDGLEGQPGVGDPAIVGDLQELADRRRRAVQRNGRLSSRGGLGRRRRRRRLR